MPDENEAAENTPPEKGGGSNLVPVIVIIIMTLGLNFALLEFFILPKIVAASSSEEEHAEEHHDELNADQFKDIVVEEAQVETVTLDKLTVNLKGSVQARYLVVELVLESSDPRLADIVEAKGYRIREVANTILGNLTLSDLEKNEIKSIVKNQLLVGFQHALNGKVVEELYIPTWMVQ